MESIRAALHLLSNLLNGFRTAIFCIAENKQDYSGFQKDKNMLKMINLVQRYCLFRICDIKSSDLFAR